MITVCLTYFRSLTLANLAAALYSVSRQDLSRVAQILVVDNDTADSPAAIRAVMDEAELSVPSRLLSIKHGDPNRTHAWSTNVAVRNTFTPWIFFTRADYLLDFSILTEFLEELDDRGPSWHGFLTANGCHLGADIAACEQSLWRAHGPGLFSGMHFDYTEIDAGVWMARRETFDRVGGLDEHLTAWGHAQTLFQHRLHESGVEFVRIPRTLFYHPHHAASRDLALAHQQLAARGVDLRALWARYLGAQPY